jgi:indolepyruvate ferredoxin oxidoreductase
MGYAFQLGRLPVGYGALMRAIELNGRAVRENQRAFEWGRLAAHDLAAVERAAAPSMRDSAKQQPLDTLDQIVEHRAAFLTDYQNAKYAQRYRGLVERTAQRERKVAGEGDALAKAVARYYFKLLAYKDEYEVGRLWTDGSFRRQLDAQFEGDYRIQIHLAPQMFFPRDPETGRAKKYALGPWILLFLGLVARLKFLRGTPLDVFGMTAHRRLERRLIGEYESTVEELIDGLSAENHDLAVEIASIPEHIRGYDTVKEQHLEEARGKQAELLQAFRLRAPASEIEQI